MEEFKGWMINVRDLRDITYDANVDLQTNGMDFRIVSNEQFGLYYRLFVITIHVFHNKLKCRWEYWDKVTRTFNVKNRTFRATERKEFKKQLVYFLMEINGEGIRC